VVLWNFSQRATRLPGLADAEPCTWQCCIGRSVRMTERADENDQCQMAIVSWSNAREGESHKASLPCGRKPSVAGELARLR
jgi:hypothetical protein